MARRAHLTLDRLDALSPEVLKNEWARRYGAPTPNISLDLLRLGLGYRLQEERLGGLSRETRSVLRQVARNAAVGEPNIPPPRKLTPGTRLVRDWHGIGHTVTVLDKGFEYDGRTWQSLTAIAKFITGTHWSGPRFFGLAGRKP
jgi:hypothetical protein